jgi:hypothetical protein
MVRKDGRLQTRIDGKDYYTSRIVWALHHGTDPANNTIVETGGTSDLRISSLKLETTANSTASEGIAVRVRSMMADKYRAQMMIGGKRLIVIGDFDTEEEAIAAKILFINTCKR